MLGLQKVIKYIAIGLSALLFVTIITFVINGTFSFIKLFGITGQKEKELFQVAVSNQNVSEVNIKLATTNLLIQTGELFSIQTNNEEIKINNNSESLSIKENSHLLMYDYESKFILTIPTNYLFNSVNIENGAGMITINELNTERLNLELGTGKVVISKLEVNELTNINGGAGKFNINDGTINNLEFNMGVGSANINSKIMGNTKIDAGVGSLNITLYGDENDYSFDLEKGIGSIQIDGKSMKNNQVIGTGTNKIKLTGGIGKITVSFKN